MKRAPLQGEFVIVVGISLHGKNRINEHGGRWEVAIAMPSGRTLLKSTDGKNAKRWVDAQGDTDFQIVDIWR